MKIKKRCFYTIATQGEHFSYFEMMKNSLEKFHPDEELIVFTNPHLKATNDKDILYRAAPYFAKRLLDKGYTEVCKIDADSIITGDLSHIWGDESDISVVFNSNPKEHKTYSVTVWNIDPLSYINNGLVVLRNKKLVDHWLKLCLSEHFKYYQMKEQDLLNIMLYYGDYSVAFLDNSNKWHGLRAKQYYPKTKLEGEPCTKEAKIILPKDGKWPSDEDKQIVAVHWAGGHGGKKMNYRTWFPEEMHKHFDWLVNP